MIWWDRTVQGRGGIDSHHRPRRRRLCYGPPSRGCTFRGLGWPTGPPLSGKAGQKRSKNKSLSQELTTFDPNKPAEHADSPREYATLVFPSHWRSLGGSESTQIHSPPPLYSCRFIFQSPKAPEVWSSVQLVDAALWCIAGWVEGTFPNVSKGKYSPIYTPTALTFSPCRRPPAASKQAVIDQKTPVKLVRRRWME